MCVCSFCVCICIVCLCACLVYYTLVDILMKRWKVLRERYMKEHIKKKRPTGTGADEVSREWEFYHMTLIVK